MEHIGYSYIRFSSGPQADGDSVRRQTSGAEAWCKRNNVPLDRNLIIDRGMSGFRSKNVDVGNLGGFLKKIEADRVKPGSYLIVESLDRITRDDVQPALRLILGILEAGVRLVQLAPREVVYDNKSDLTDIVLMIVELSRGNSESRVKSVRASAVRQRLREEARAGSAVSGPVPAWVRREGDGFALIPDRAETVRRIFRMAAAGQGTRSIVADLTRDRVPCFGRSGKWNRTYVLSILSDRRAIGECQPCGAGRKAEGEPIPGYYPPAVPVNEYNRVASGLKERKRFQGRQGKSAVNVFAGLVENAGRPGDTFILSTRRSDSTGPTGSKSYPVLCSKAGMDGGAKWVGIPYEPFERCIFGELREVDVAELLDDDQGDDELHALRRELEQLEVDRAVLLEQLAGPVSPTLAKAAALKDERFAHVVARIAELEAAAESPLSSSWAEGKTLLAQFDAATDKQAFRLRFRPILRRIVSRVHLLMVPRGLERLCFVQIRFRGSERRREYIIRYRPGTNPGGKRSTPPTATCWSPEDTMPEAVELDMTEATDVRAMERRLLAWKL